MECIALVMFLDKLSCPSHQPYPVKQEGISSGMTTARKTDKRIGQALRNLLCGALFLLCGRRPYVSIVWRSTICFYYVPVGHMFLLCARSAICFYWVALGHMFLLCV